MGKPNHGESKAKQFFEAGEDFTTVFESTADGECKSKLFGKSQCDAGLGSCFQLGCHSFEHQCLRTAWRHPESHSLLPGPHFGTYPVFMLDLAFGVSAASRGSSLKNKPSQ